MAQTNSLPDDPLQYAQMLRQIRVQPAGIPGSFPVRHVLWLALAPAWPERIAQYAFRGRDGKLNSEDVVPFLNELEKAGLAESGPGELDSEETWYTMSRRRRASVLEEIVRTRGLPFVQSSLLEAAASMKQAGSSLGVELTAAVERWAELGALASNVASMADRVDRRVEEALERARSLRQLACPEALRWIETAEPLADIFGGVLLVAVERAKRRLELFHRQARDERYLDNYLQREAQDRAFRDLLSDDATWALHYVGVGGMGKSMLLRHIRLHLASDLNLVTARIDFDDLSPDYPDRAPGLLLMGLAEELRLRIRDPKIVEIFKAFDDVVKSVHDKLEGAFRGGEQQSTTGIAEGSDRAVDIFVSALHTIYDLEKRQPLLILDTCEELAKLRADGSLPNNVVKTFEVLERIHKQFEKVRVIFAGRRPLAGSGYGWKWKDCALPPRPYLRLHEIQGFERGEAEKLLEAYHKEERRVPRDLWDPIIKQSAGVQDQKRDAIEWGTAAAQQRVETVRYNPYDLDLYASWACSGEGLSRERLEAGGSHYYIKERILGRVAHALLQWLADIVLLGRFDREMMAELTGLEGTAFSNFFDYVVGLEWIDTDHTARSKGEVWAIDRRLRQRLVSYYRQEDLLAWKNARKRAGQLLRRLTIDRNWDEMAVAYFETAFDVLQDDPAEAAEWWQELETKIARDAAWDWARDITERLLADEGPAGLANPALQRPPESESVLRPAVRATQASAYVHAQPPKDTRPIWQEVLQKFSRHPTGEGAERLRYRAFAGLAPSVEALVNRPDDSDFQCLASEIAMIERVIEEWERGNVSLPNRFTGFSSFSQTAGRSEPDFRQYLSSCLAEFPVKVSPPDLAAFRESLLGRWKKLNGNLDAVHSCFERALEYRLESEPQHWSDWKRPLALRSRILLEWLRASPTALQRVQENMSGYGPSFMNVDVDRLASAVMLIARRHRVPDGEERFLLTAPEISLEPECNAHRAFPPRLVSHYQAVADVGRFAEVLRSYERLSDTPLSLEVRQGIDRVLLETVVRMRLGEERIGTAETSVNQSAVTRDLVLRATVSLLMNELHADDRGYFSGRWNGLAQLNALSGFLQAAETNLLSPDAAFEEFSVGLDRLETDILSSGGRTEPDRALRQTASEWRNRHPKQFDNAFTLLIRCLALSRQLPAPDVENLKLGLGTFELARRLDETGVSPLLEDVGIRRAAEIALEEGSLLALRLGGHAAPVLHLARYWFDRVQDRLGTFLAAASLALLYARQGDRASFESQMKVLERCYEAYRNQDRTIRSWYLVAGSVQEPEKSEKPAVDFLKESPREWRPWVIRVCACMVRAAEFNQPGSQTQALEAWLNEHYRQNWPPELRGVLAVSQPRPDASPAPPPAAQPEPGPQPAVPAAPPQRRRSIRENALTVGVVAVSLAFLALVISNTYQVIEALVQGNFRSLTIVQVLFFLFIVIALIPPVLKGAIKNLQLFDAAVDLFPGPGEAIQGPIPLVTVTARLEPRVRFLPGGLGTATQLQPVVNAPPDGNPQALFESSAPNKALARGVSWTSKLKVELAIYSAFAGLPWEAVLSNHQPLPGARFRRRIDRPGPVVPFANSLSVCTWVSDLPDYDVARIGWRPLAGRRGVTYALLDPREQNLNARAGETETGVLHVIGSAVETASGLRIRMSRTTSPYEVSSARIVTLSTDLRLCILQAFPAEFTVRTRTDRDGANLMRSFAAELARAGIPAVITLPPLLPAMAVVAIEKLARVLARKRGNAIPPILTAIADIQATIRGKANEIPGGLDAAQEAAFDVCFYGTHELSLRWQ